MFNGIGMKNKIDKSQLQFGIEHRVRDRKYLDRAKDGACENCGGTHGVVSAHVRVGNEGGTGLKPSDDLTVLLCFHCHAAQEANPGIDWWLGIFKKLLKDRYAEWKYAERQNSK